ncbi:uncharacterized protein [Battus philenor]|uniref:uncharacterized protein n=1 Tax=Battus philenor TaxID=42288 RepID=UPI0035D0F0CC
MAFSIRRMFSNMNYFKKTEDTLSSDTSKNNTREFVTEKSMPYESAEPDSTSRQCTSLNIPESVKKFALNKASLSDTDLLNLNADSPIRHRRKRCKKLTLDIKKASKSMSARLNCASEDEACSSNAENTPKHILLECVSSDVFRKGFNMGKTFDIYDGTTDDQMSSQFDDENLDVESLSDNSYSDLSINPKKKSIKMCRKVEQLPRESSSESLYVPSATPDSFEEMEIDKNEEEKVKLLQNYQSKLGKIESFLKDMLNEFQFHIEVSKIFNNRAASKNMREDDIPTDSINRKPSPTDSWSIIMEKEDDKTKTTVKKQLESIKQSIEDFITIYLQNYERETRNKKCRRYSTKKKHTKSELHKRKFHSTKRVHMSNKKKIKYFDFPDLREAMINLFYPDHETSLSITSDSDDSVTSKCACQCHQETLSNTDSGLISKTNDRSLSNHSITSSIGNFSLDSSTLTAYSESLDQIISYNSFQDTSLYNTFLQKSAMERITFYVQVHSIQIKCETSEQDFESKNIITFYCPTCKNTDSDENSLIRHILSQYHCEKIHFQYKTAYIKKCVSEGREIQPSTVLNSMRMYRDDNKIVCFGDAMYACSLCFENLIVGESVLMDHCASKDHVERRERLGEVV